MGASAGLDISPETRTFSSAIVCEGQPRDERVYWLAGVRQEDHQLYRCADEETEEGDGGKRFGEGMKLRRREREGGRSDGRLGRN
jgi:hypothetical protein